MSNSCNPWTVACLAPLSMGFSRQEYWSGLPFSSPGNPPNPGIELASPALTGGFFTIESPSSVVVIWFVCVWTLSCVQLFETPWAVALQAPPSMGFCRQEYWSGLPFPPPGDLLTQGSDPRLLHGQADSLPSESPGKPSYLV